MTNAQKITTELILSYFSHVIDLPIPFFNTRKTGDILSRLTDAADLVETLTRSFFSALLDGLFILVMTILLLKQNAWLFLVTLLSFPLYGLTVAFFIPRYNLASKKERGGYGELTSHLVESLSGIITFKTHSALTHISQTIDQQFDHYFSLTYKLLKLDYWQDTSRSIIEAIQLTTVLVVGAHFIIKGQLTLGQLVTFNALAAFFIEPLKDLIHLQGQWQKAHIAHQRLQEILSIPTEETLLETPSSTQTITHFDLKLDHLYFSHEEDHPILEKLSCFIPYGDKLALTGPSGCGKSTLGQLLVSFYSPSDGTIYLDSTPLKDLSLDFIRHHILYIPQEAFFIKGSIKDNLLLGLSDHERPNDFTIKSLFDQLGLSTFYSQLPNGLETYLEENAANLSGGQRQALAIVRALLHPAHIYIFDESTSAMDEQMTSHVLSYLITIPSTVLFISHQSFCRHYFPRVVKLNQGTWQEVAPISK